MNKLIVGLVGYSESGKSSTARTLERSINTPSIIKPLADFVRFEINNRLPEMSLEYLRQKPTPVSLRLLLQGWGSTMRNIYGDDHYVLKFKRFLEGPEVQEIQLVIVDDVRRPIEAQFIKDQGGVLISVTNEDKPNEAEQSKADSVQQVQAAKDMCDRQIFLQDSDFYKHEGKQYVKSPYLEVLTQWIKEHISSIQTTQVGVTYSENVPSCVNVS